jgi:hypothetical protein
MSRCIIDTDGSTMSATRKAARADALCENYEFAMHRALRIAVHGAIIA